MFTADYMIVLVGLGQGRFVCFRKVLLVLSERTEKKEWFRKYWRYMRSRRRKCYV